MTLDRIKILRLQHTANTAPSGASGAVYLWETMWAAARVALSIDLHSLLPTGQLQRIDSATVELLNTLGVETTRQHDDPSYRRFIVNGHSVRWSDHAGRWIS